MPEGVRFAASEVWEIMALEDMLGVCVRSEKGVFVVDWEKMHDLCLEDYNRVVNYFMEVGILSVDPHGNFGVYANGVCVNPPRDADSPLYFTSEAEARRYKVAVCEDTLDRIVLMRTEVIQ